MGFSDSGSEHKETTSTGNKSTTDVASNSQTPNGEIKINNEIDKNSTSSKRLSSFSSENSESSRTCGVVTKGKGNTSLQSIPDRSASDTSQTPEQGMNVGLHDSNYL